MNTTDTSREHALRAAENMDWMQVILNQSAPCFHLDKNDVQFCGRAQKWPGHEEPQPIHKFVSLAEFLRALSS